MESSVETAPSGEHWLVHVVVSLDRKETSELFMAGDRLVSWPIESLVSDPGEVPIQRGSMFLSEIVSKVDGLKLLFAGEEQATRAAKILRYQLDLASGGLKVCRPRTQSGDFWPAIWRFRELWRPCWFPGTVWSSVLRAKRKWTRR